MQIEFPISVVCPRDRLSLAWSDDHLQCERGHSYPIVDGVPILLLDDVRQTHDAANLTLTMAKCQPHFREGSLPRPSHCEVDPYVQENISATNGRMYRGLIGRLRDYPLPTLRLPRAAPFQVFLDIGCNWGRWSIAAARLGYRPIGIDPSLEAIRAARRVARQLGIRADFLVADGRYLPFADASIDLAFSYSVLQHFSKPDASSVLREIRRVIKTDGSALIQMANGLSVLGLNHQLPEASTNLPGSKCGIGQPSR